MIEIRQGHILDELAKLPDESAQCVVTSPPIDRWLVESGQESFLRCKWPEYRERFPLSEEVQRELYRGHEERPAEDPNG